MVKTVSTQINALWCVVTVEEQTCSEDTDSNGRLYLDVREGLEGTK